MTSLRTFIIAILLFPVLASGQEQTVRTLTIEEAVRLAMERNSALKEARLELDRADARVHEAWGYALPSLSVSSTYARALKKQVFFLPNDFRDPSKGSSPVTVGGTHSLTASLTASQILFNGTVFAGVGAASIYSDAARDVYRARQLETVTTVKQAFYGTLLAREGRDLMQSSLKNAEDNLRNVQLLRQQGVLSEFDELRATVGVDNLRPTVIQAETAYSLSLEGLKIAVGLNPDISIAPTGTMNFTPVDDSLISRAEMMVLASNPGLAALQKQIEVNEAFVLAERSNYLPTIAAFGNYQYLTQKENLRISTNDFVATSQVGLQFSMNLFQGFQTNARVEQMQVNVLQSQEQLTSTERNLKIGVMSIIGNLTAAQKRIAAQERTVEQAQKSFEIVTTRFLSGAATQLEVNDAQLALMQAKMNRVQALYDYLIAEAQFDQLLGRLPAYAQQTDIE